MGKPKSRPAAGGTAVVTNAPCRLIVTFYDGTWTDNLAAERYELECGRDGTTLTLHVVARERPGKRGLARRALEDFGARRGRVESIIVGAPGFGSKLRTRVRESERGEVRVKLALDGRQVLYPAAAVFGPDCVTLHLG